MRTGAERASGSARVAISRGATVVTDAGVLRPGIGRGDVEQTERGHADTAHAQHDGGEGGAEGPPAQWYAPVAS